MHFIGIIAQNKTSVQEIASNFLGREKYSIVFSCQSMDEFNLLPAQNRRRAAIIFVDTGENYFELVQQLKHLRSDSLNAHIMLLSSIVDTAAPARIESSLTNREKEIALLVLKGLTNKMIGETLRISTCTVNAHLRKIFSKLSVKSRTELAYRMINL